MGKYQQSRVDRVIEIIWDNIDSFNLIVATDDPDEWNEVITEYVSKLDEEEISEILGAYDFVDFYGGSNIPAGYNCDGYRI